MSRLHKHFRQLVERAGWVRRPAERTVLIRVPEAAACELVAPVIAALRERYERLRFAFLAPDAAGRAWLSRHFPGDPVLAFPWRNRLSCLLFLLSSRARLIIAVRSAGYLDPELIRRSYYLGVPLVVLDAVQRDPTEAPRLASLVDCYLPRDAATAAELRALGVPGERIRTFGPASVDAARIADALVPLLARRPPLRRPMQRAVLAAMDHRLLRRILGLRVERIDTLADFRRRLGNPETILCLGNGPSSEDPALVGMAHDSLFRVNHRWRARGLLSHPDVVFTGQKRTLFTIEGSIFGFQTRQAEAQLVTHQIFNPFCRRMHYVTLERFGLLTGLDWNGLRPTNGAAMLAAAVVLQPRRLIIAGIDLFQHPQGSYPGDSKTPNAYVPTHDRDLELDFILQTLDEYRGELVIIGEALARQVRARCRGHARRVMLC